MAESTLRPVSENERRARAELFIQFTTAALQAVGSITAAERAEKAVDAFLKRHEWIDQPPFERGWHAIVP